MSRSKTPRPAAYSVASAPAVAGFRPAGAALAVAAALGMQPGAALAQPTGGQVIHGQASFTSNGNNLLVRTQNGAGNFSAINWQSFSIPAGSVTRFVQPTRDSTSINRVVGNDPSAIFGTLRSNGKLVLVNQSGIAVGAGAVVDTAGFTASTLGMSDEDAASGRLRFAGNDAGALTVDGSIVARSGDIVLIAPNVKAGEAALVQSHGATVLAAGRKVEITGRGLEGIHLEVQAGDRAVNLGTLKGDAVGIFAHTLRHSGLVQAQAVTEEGGKVVLKSAGGDTMVSGAIVASAGQRGGSVDVLGERVGLMAGTAIDVSGAQGGGQVRIGGDYQGANADVPNAKATYVDAAATIRADATGQGNGGRVIVWADGSTRMHGDISARGGEEGGNGGFAEVSGKQFLEFAGRVDLRAPQGAAGTLLLDPTDIVISGNGPTQTSVGPIFSGGGDTSNIRDTTLAAQLERGNVQVTTDNVEASGPNGGSITLSANADVAWGSGTTLGLFADTSIQLDGRITAIGEGGANGVLHLQAGTSIQQGSTSVLRVGGVFAQSANGGISLTGANLMNRFQGVAGGAGSGISVVNAAPLAIDHVPTAYDASGTYAIRAGGNVDITTTSGDLRVQPGAGLNVGGNALLNAACSCSDVRIDDASLFVGGALQVMAGQDVRIGARTDLGETSTSLNGSSGLNISAGRSVLVGNTVFFEGGSNTSLQSSGDVAINAATGDIRFRANAGFFVANSVQGDGTGDTTINAAGDIHFGGSTHVFRRNGSIDVGAGGSILGEGVFQTDGRNIPGTDVGSIELNAAAGAIGFREVRSQGSFSGMSAGDVKLTAQGDISGGSILASGTSSFGPTTAGSGSMVNVTSSNGSIDLGSVRANGGSVSPDSAGMAGAGGKGGSVVISTNGNVSGYDVDVSGGSGAVGGAAGSIAVTSGGSVRFQALHANGGFSDSDSIGGRGGAVTVNAAGDIALRSFGKPAVSVDGGSSYIGRGGDAGFIAVSSKGGSIVADQMPASVDVLAAAAVGPAPGFSANGGYGATGGDGGNIELEARGNIRTDGVQAVGGHGEVGLGGDGGAGGIASVTFGGVLNAPFIDASGGAGGSSSQTRGGGDGGRGGTVIVVGSSGDLVLDSGIQLVARGGDGGGGERLFVRSAGFGGSGGLIDVSSAGGAVILTAPEIHAQSGLGGTNDDGTIGAGGREGVFTAAGTTVEVQGAMQLHSRWENRSDVRIAGSSSVTGEGTFVNFGDVRLSDSAALLPRNGVHNYDGRIEAVGSNVQLNLINNDGLFEVAAGAMVTAPDFSFNVGKVVVDGTLNIGAGAGSSPAAIATGFSSIVNSEISGSGNLVVDGGRGTFSNFGTISPGGAGALGTLTITGNLVMYSYSKLALDFGSGTSFDKVIVSGTAATRSGSAVNVSGGGTVPAGSYTVLQAASLDARILPTVTPTVFEAAATGTELQLKVAAPPPPPPPPAVQNDVVIFAELFVKEATAQDPKNKGKDDIVITDTACKP